MKRFAVMLLALSSLAQAYPVEVKTTDGRTVWVELDVLKNTLLNALGQRSLEQDAIDFVGKTAIVTRPRVKVAGKAYRVGHFTGSDVCRLYGFGPLIESDPESLAEQTMASIGPSGEFRRLISWDRAYLRVSCAGAR
jgi:hypothetical protein